MEKPKEKPSRRYCLERAGYPSRYNYNLSTLIGVDSGRAGRDAAGDLLDVNVPADRGTFFGEFDCCRLGNVH